MDVQTIINNAVAQFTASLTKDLKPNEAAAAQQIVQGIVALIEAEAVNRGGPAMLAGFVKKYTSLASVVNQIPELKTLLS